VPSGSPPATKSLRLLAAAGSLLQRRMTAPTAAVDFPPPPPVDFPPPPVGPGTAGGGSERRKGREKDGGRDGWMDAGREGGGWVGSSGFPVKLGVRVWRGEAEEQRADAASCLGRASRCFVARCLP
jgi:hypothetical protein